MKKYKTVNNWVCQNFITSLVHGSYRQCCFLAFNTFDDCLTSNIKSKMLRYLFNQFVDILLFNQLLNTLPLEVKFYVNTEFYKYLHHEKNQ